ncbi:MAG: nucleotide sugar dehydrogenase [Defluviitaleaceae bacterium]|nr:nucleotide sugar dehydrogenase [Defluviitaleaceae bacterium]
MEDMKIAVLGLGFVGLTAAAGFASKGFNVTAFDTDSSRRKLISEGTVPFFEPDLTATGFKVAQTQDEATKDADIVFICVGTPQGKDGSVDLTYINTALQTLSAPANCLVVIKSTVLPGTTASLKSRYKLANNPEFLREGHAWEDFINPDRTVCGVTDEHSKQLLETVYKPFNAPIHFTTLNTAEFIKYLSNTMLATMISYANEMSLIAGEIGDIHTKTAFEILHQDKRLKNSGIAHYIYPGAGYGGGCLPKDTQALAYVAKEKANILRKVIDLNNAMPQINCEKIVNECKSKESTITILGLSFKPGSDDVRESTAAKIIELLLANGYKNITAYDPIATEEFKKHYNFNINYELKLGDVTAIATAWSEFKSYDYSNTTLVDLRYVV